MSTHNIGFNEEISRIIFQISSNVLIMFHKHKFYLLLVDEC